MNAREKDYLSLLVNMGIALMQESRKTNIDQDGDHSIVFQPETGYVDAYIVIDGKQYHASRFDQFPEIEYREINTNDLQVR